MNAVAIPAPPTTEKVARTINWFPVAVFGLVWLELISRLRFEWSINPQYGYGWAVPILAAYVFWRRWESAPPPSSPGSSVLLGSLIILAALCLAPIRLIQEANPEYHSICAVCGIRSDSDNRRIIPYATFWE